MKKALGLANVAVGFLALFLLVASIKELASIGHIGDSAPVNTITVSGTGNAYAIPDVATFSFTVTENASTVSAAQTAATTKVNSALAAVKSAGVADSDIQTTGYTIDPNYEYENAVCPTVAPVGGTAVYCPSGKQVLDGYDVSETIQVKVRDLTKAGDIFASIGSLDVENVNGLDFSVDNPDTVQAEARTAAISDAQSKAKELAHELGVSLSTVTSFSENTGNFPEPLVYAMSAAVGSAPAAAPAVPAGQQEVTDNVTITYQIR